MDEKRIDAIFDLIEKLFPEKAETISKIGLVHWNNIINHCTLEELVSDEIFLVASLIFALAQTRCENFIETKALDFLKPVSFDDAIDFLDKPSKEGDTK